MFLGLTWLALLLGALGIVRVLSLVFRTGEVSYPTALIAGIPLLGAMIHLVGLVSLEVPVLAALVLPLASIGLFSLRSFSLAPIPTPSGWSEWLSVVVLVLILLASGLMALAPPVFKDEVAYHLAVPATWIAEGRIVELSLLSHSYFPFAGETAILPLIAVGGKLAGGIASHILFFGIGAATLWYLLSWKRSWPLAAAIATIPALAISMGAVMLEWLLVGLSLIVMREISREGRLALVGLAVAAGWMTKYSFPLVLIPVLVATVAERRVRVAAAMAMGGICGSLFLVRNWWWTGNPIEPILSSESSSILRFRAVAEGGSGGFAGYAFDPRFFEEALGLTPWLLFGLGAWALLRARRDSEAGAMKSEKLVLLGSIALLVVLILIGPSARILVPLVVVGMIAAHGLAGSQRGRDGALSVASFVQGGIPVLFVIALQPWSVVTGLESSERFLAERRSAHRQVLEMNRVIEEDQRVLVLGHFEPFWIEGNVRSGANGDEERVTRVAKIGSVPGRFDWIFCFAPVDCSAGLTGYQELARDESVTVFGGE